MSMSYAAKPSRVIAVHVAASTTVMSKPARLADEASRLLAPSCTVVPRIKAFFAGAAVAESRAVENVAHARHQTGRRVLIGISSLLMLVDPGLRRRVAGLPLLGASGGCRQSVRSRSQEPHSLRENADVHGGRPRIAS